MVACHLLLAPSHWRAWGRVKIQDQQTKEQMPGLEDAGLENKAPVPTAKTGRGEPGCTGWKVQVTRKHHDYSLGLKVSMHLFQVVQRQCNAVLSVALIGKYYTMFESIFIIQRCLVWANVTHFHRHYVGKCSVIVTETDLC